MVRYDASLDGVSAALWLLQSLDYANDLTDIRHGTSPSYSVLGLAHASLLTPALAELDEHIGNCCAIHVP